MFRNFVCGNVQNEEVENKTLNEDAWMMVAWHLALAKRIKSSAEFSLNCVHILYSIVYAYVSYTLRTFRNARN